MELQAGGKQWTVLSALYSCGFSSWYLAEEVFLLLTAF